MFTPDDADPPTSPSLRGPQIRDSAPNVDVREADGVRDAAPTTRQNLLFRVFNAFAAMDVNPMPATQRLVLAALANRANRDTDMAWPSVECLETDTGLGASTIRKALHELEERGWVVFCGMRGIPGRMTKAYLVRADGRGWEASSSRHREPPRERGSSCEPLQTTEPTPPNDGAHPSKRRSPPLQTTEPTPPPGGDKPLREPPSDPPSQPPTGEGAAASAPRPTPGSGGGRKVKAQDTYVEAFRRGLDAQRERVPATAAVRLTAPKLGATIGEAVGATSREHGIQITGEDVQRFIERATSLFVRYEAGEVAKLGSKGASRLSPHHFGVWLKGLTKGDVEAILAGKATGAEHVIFVFRQEHRNVLGATYALGEEDFAAAARIVNAARQHARDVGGQLKPWIEHWVRTYLNDEKAKGRRAAIKYMAERPVNTLGRPGETVTAANTGARGPAINFRPAGTLQPEGGWIPHGSAADHAEIDAQVERELAAEEAARTAAQITGTEGTAA